jgi:GNAT superfamily N-acetyltransferase
MDWIREFSSAELINIIEANLEAWVPELGKMGRMSVNDPPGVIRSIVDIPTPFFNSIMNTKLSPVQVDATIQAIILDAKVRKVPALWWVGPSTQPTDLDEHLVKSGFTVDENGPGMAVELARLNEGLREVSGLSIRLAQDDDTQWTWCRTMAQGFGIPADKEFVVKAWHDLLSLMNAELVLPYLGWLNGKPVSVCLLFLGAGVAGIYSVATIPEARRRGAGAWVTLHALLQARLKGYKVGVLEASEMGGSVYRLLGFQAYCRICSYVFRP